MITVQSLHYTYPHADRPSLTDVSFHIEQGECVGIVGLNGAGKSTLCYALMGLIPHFYHGDSSGSVIIDDVRVDGVDMGEMAKHVGLVFQNPVHQFSGAKATVVEEIAFGLENLGVSRPVMPERIDWVTKLLDIHHLRDRNPFELSGGQMQRVAIASILALKPKVLVLDEPTSQLDPFGTAEVFAAVDTLRNEGITIVIVEHKVDLLVAHCSRIGVMQDGRLMVMDEPGAVFSHPAVESWGVEAPRYSQAYRAVDAAAQTVPTTLEQTIERLKKYEQSHRR